MTNTALWMAYKQSPDTILKKQIVLRYVNLVHYVIQNSKFAILKNVVDERDYFQFGIEGLSEAIERFDPEYGTKFETYAIQRIRGKIIDELRKIQSKPRTTGESEPIRYKMLSLNESCDGEDGYQLYETIPADVDSPDTVHNKNEEKELLLQALKELPERDRLIITLYYYENLSYKEIAEILKITVSRVSQVHTRIINELKGKLQKRYV